MKGREFRSLLSRELGYAVTRTRGSHRVLRAPGRPQLIFAFADGDTIGGTLVRDILVKQVGLSLSEAEEVASR